MARRNTGCLAIWLNTRHVADLSSDGRGRMTLTYTESTVDEFGIGALCLAVPLPVVPTPYRGDRVLNWAEGLLPEGETRTALERSYGVDRGDTYGLLAAIGRDCAGAIMFLPAGDVPATVVPDDHSLTASDIADAIEALPTAPLGAGADVRVSLGGLQAKLLLTRSAGGGWSRPAAGLPSTHILKPEPPQFAGLAAAEAFTLRAAAFAGMDAAEVELIDVAGRPVLLVTRFDRRTDGTGVIVRIHQEDGSQALGLSPDRQKYQRSAGGQPSLLGLANVLRDHSVDPIREMRRLLAMTTLHVAIDNTDAHVRNHAFLHRDGAVVLAPLYDAAPTRRFVRSRQFALWIGDQPYVPAVSADHLVDEARRWGLPRSAVVEVVTDTLERLRAGLEPAVDSTPEIAPAIVTDCAERIDALLGQLTGQQRRKRS